VTVGAEGRVSAGARERRSPALSALFDVLVADGRHSILDLGPASGSHLRILGPYASQIRFANLLTVAAPGDSWSEAVRGLPPNEARPYDVVLAWDVLDRLEPPGRTAFMARLVEVTAAKARLYAIAGGEAAEAMPLAFTLVDRDRLVERPSGVTTVGRKPLLPAEMERVLAPFEVASAYMLRTGAREYVAVKPVR
jgi:hypothetical protein